MISAVKLILKGGIIGIANIIPGVSGGTMAVVLGIYEKLIEAIGNILIDKKKRKEYFIFLIKVFFGAGIAIIIFSWVMDYLLTHYEQYTYLFFIGLILGSIPSIYKTHPNMQLSLPAALTFLAGIALILIIFIFAPVQDETKVVSTTISLDSYQAFMLIISGFFSGGSMIMPGISGSCGGRLDFCQAHR
jgi:putative membrane protein